MVKMLCEGLGVRAIARLTGLHQETILNVLTSAGEHCAKLLDAKVRRIVAEQVEVDELYSYVGCHPANAPRNDPERGEFFCYLSLDRQTKLIISHRIGKHDGANALAFMQDLKDRLAARCQLSTDGFKPYGGRPGAVYQTFGEDVDHGQEIKVYGPESPSARRFSRPVCKFVTRRPRIGNPDLRGINTSRAERLNLSVRLFNRRFTRCTMGFSRKLENHRHAAALMVAVLNFCRVHSAHGKTPAHAAGLTDRAWTVGELLGAA